MYGPTPNWKLASAQVYKAYVIHNALILSTESNISFTTLISATTQQIVTLLLEQFFKSKSIASASHHQCPECCRYKRIWNVDEDGRERRIIGNKAKGFVEDAIIDEESVENLAVIDGITIGHRVSS